MRNYSQQILDKFINFLLAVAHTVLTSAHTSTAAAAPFQA